MQHEVVDEDPYSCHENSYLEKKGLGGTQQTVVHVMDQTMQDKLRRLLALAME